MSRVTRGDWRTPGAILDAVAAEAPDLEDPFAPLDPPLRYPWQRRSNALGCTRWPGDQFPAALMRAAANRCAASPCGEGCGWAPWPIEVPIWLQPPYAASEAGWRRLARELDSGRRIAALLPDAGSRAAGPVLARAGAAIRFPRLQFELPGGVRGGSPPAYSIWLVLSWATDRVEWPHGGIRLCGPSKPSETAR